MTHRARGSREQVPLWVTRGGTETEATTEKVQAARTEEVQATTEKVQATLTEEVQATTEEVQATTEKVQATTEEVQGTTEEVQATTEEVQATTEEVQATTEEVRNDGGGSSNDGGGSSNDRRRFKGNDGGAILNDGRRFKQRRKTILVWNVWPEHQAGPFWSPLLHETAPFLPYPVSAPSRPHTGANTGRLPSSWCLSPKN